VATLTATRPDIGQARRLVVKVGSALLVDAESGALKSGWLAALAEDVAALRADGVAVVLVSSGAIALGRRVLGLSGPRWRWSKARPPPPSARSGWRGPGKRPWPPRHHHRPDPGDAG
jgi:hypothetical protein